MKHLRCFHPICLTFLLALPFLTSCNGAPATSHSPVSSPTKPHFITSFKTDSFATFQFEKNYYFYENGFVFSPYDSKKIWLTPENHAAFELDLETGAKQPLATRFNHAFFNERFRANGIQPDSLHRNLCWFLSSYKGVYCHDESKGSGQFYDVAANRRAISAIAFSKDKVWIGTSEGLWYIDRKSGQYGAVDHTPNSWVYKIVITSDGKIHIGNGFAYDPAVNCWENNAIQPWRDESTFNQMNYRFTQYLPNHTGSGYRVCFAGGHVWQFGQDYWFTQQPDAAEPTNLQPLFKKRIQSLSGDDRYLFVFTDSLLAIVNQKYLLTKCLGDQHLFTRIRRLNWLEDSLQLNKSDQWLERQAKMNYIAQLFSGEKDAYLLWKIQYYRGVFSLPQDEKSLATWIKQPGLDENTIKTACGNVVSNLIHQGEWQKAVELADKFNVQSALNRHNPSKGGNMLDYFREAVKEFNRIKNSDAAEDEKSWLIAERILKTSLESQYFNSGGCGGTDLNLAFKAYNKFLKHYPKSSRADDVEFQIASLSSSWNEGDVERSVWEAFLKKYPNSNCQAEAKIRLANCFYNGNVAEVKRGLTLFAEAEKASPQIFSGKNGEFYNEWRGHLEKRLEELLLEFSISLKKDRVKTGEPVEITFSLLNKHTKTQTIPQFAKKDVPNFFIEVAVESDGTESCLNNPQFYDFNDRSVVDDPNTYHDVLLKPQKYYTETWDITKMARKHHQYLPGRYTFDRPGVYVITAYHGEKQAGPLKFTVE